MTASKLAARSRVGATRTARSRAILALVGSVIGAVGYVLFLYLHAPWEPGVVVPYAEMVQYRDTWLTTHYWLGPLAALGFIVLGPEAGAALLAHLVKTELYFPIFGIGLDCISPGCLIAAIALVVSKAVPVVVPIVLIIGVVAMAVAPHSISWWASSPVQIAAVAISWYGLKRTQAA